MPVAVFDSIAQLRDRVGSEVLVGDWIEVDQGRIDLFGHATGDVNWIHLDVERAVRESPYRGTIAHGWFTLTAIARSLLRDVVVKDAPLITDHELGKVRFMAPVRAGARIRARSTLSGLVERDGRAELAWQSSVDIENENKPACVAESRVSIGPWIRTAP